MTRRLTLSFAVCIVFLLSQVALCQQILIDQGVRAGGLWCFPLGSDTRQYVYIPTGARLGTDRAGNPQFSFLQYVVNIPSDNGGSTTITKASGGGILHFLVLYETPQETIDNAQKLLRQNFNDDEIVIRAPIVFERGRYILVSSILNSEDGSTDRKLLATGRAPVLEGNKLALSFDLEPQEASLLMESFKMATPEVSLVFDMTFTGLSEAYEAELLVDWSKVHTSMGLEAGGSVYFLSAEVESKFDELRQDNAIQLRSSGTDATMEVLLTNVYTKLLELMFRPIEPERLPPDQRGGIADAIDALFDAKNGILSSRKTTGFGAFVGYQLKYMKSEGTSILNFNHRANVSRNSFIAFNIGDFYKRYGDNPDYFRAVNLDDPTYQQRNVRIKLDGALIPEFESFINSVTATIRKNHQNGETTLREQVINPEILSNSDEITDMIYGWKEDHDRMAWLTYEYKMNWSFKGGGSYETEWQETNAPMINLFAPYERRIVQLMGDGESLKNSDVWAVVVRIEYPFFGQNKRQQMVIRPENLIDGKQMEIIQPLGQFDYDYNITWIFSDGRRSTQSGMDSSGVLFVDELSEN